MSGAKLSFHGAAGTVTGSKFLLESGGSRVLVDCGLFQGLKALRERNWAAPPVRPGDLDAVLMTHAHLDHSGYLPVLVRNGFQGPIHCTAPTRELCEILLRDAGRIQEEDARYANRKGFSKHAPARPLYDEAEARRVFPLLQPVDFDQPVRVGSIEATFVPAGHILGAAGIQVRHDGGRILFSGDLGRQEDPFFDPPRAPGEADWIVMESTYGDRLHGERDPVEAIGAVARSTLERDGVLLVPSFAVGRAQAILFCLDQAFRRDLAPRAPVFLDSPMATDVTELYVRYARYHKLSREECVRAFRLARFVQSTEESKALSRREGPMVIVSASGMLTGGRVLHHLKAFAPGKRNTILLPGYQAAGTRGAALLRGASSVKVHGMYVDVEAEVKKLDVFSAHADQWELLHWLDGAPRPPSRLFLVHGEPAAADELRRLCVERFGVTVKTPELGDSVAWAR